jgi:hypothetical protein
LRLVGRDEFRAHGTHGDFGADRQRHGQPGPIVLNAADGNREGTIDAARVGDTGQLTASRTLAPADDSAQAATFQLTGTGFSP